MPKNVGDFGKLIVAKGFKKLPKVKKIAKSGHTAGGLVKWLWEKTHVQKVMSWNPGTICWMDIFSLTFLL